MTNEELSQLGGKLQAMSPALLQDMLVYLRQDPQLSSRYSEWNLRELAVQAIDSFRNIIVGAVEFDVPQIVNTEFVWLEKLLAARAISADNIRNFLEIHKGHYQNDLTPAEAAPLVKIVDGVLEKF